MKKLIALSCFAVCSAAFSSASLAAPELSCNPNTNNASQPTSQTFPGVRAPGGSCTCYSTSPTSTSPGVIMDGTWSCTEKADNPEVSCSCNT